MSLSGLTKRLRQGCGRMVKVKNVFGDEYKGKQGNAVYQKFYGKQIRRLWDGRKKNDAPGHKKQQERFRVGLSFWSSLTREQREFLRGYVAAHYDGLTAQQWAVKVALSRPRAVLQAEQIKANIIEWRQDWDAVGWTYRQEITIKNNTASELKDYPVKLELDSNNVGINFNWNSRGADLRFYDGNGTKLSYYVESWDSVNKTATVWVNVGLIPASGSTTVKMYYGNTAAQSESTVYAKWFIYEDMTSPPAGTLKGSAYYDAENKRVVLTEAKNYTNGELEYIDTFNSYYAEFTSYSGDGSGADAVYFYVGATATPTDEDKSVNGYILAIDDWTDDLQIRYNSTKHYVDTADVHNRLLHNKAKVIRRADGTYLVELSNELGTISETWTNTPAGSLIGIGARTGGKNDWHILYSLKIKKQVEPEPTVTIGTEEDGRVFIEGTKTIYVKAIEHVALKKVELYDQNGQLLGTWDDLSNLDEGKITTIWRIPDDVADSTVKAVVYSLAGTVDIVNF